MASKVLIDGYVQQRADGLWYCKVSVELQRDGKIVEVKNIDGKRGFATAEAASSHLQHWCEKTASDNVQSGGTSTWYKGKGG